MGPIRFLLYAVHSGPQLHPLGGRLLQLSKAHGISQTRNPALRREGYFTFVECRRRCILGNPPYMVYLCEHLLQTTRS